MNILQEKELRVGQNVVGPTWLEVEEPKQKVVGSHAAFSLQPFLFCKPVLSFLYAFKYHQLSRD